MKKVLAIVLAAAMLLSLAACGKKAETPAAAEAAPAATEAAKAEAAAAEAAPAAEEHEAVTLSCWIYNDPGSDVIYQAWADQVHAEYPWITVEIEVIPYDSGPEKFTVACATNTTPDLYYDVYSRIAPAVNSGLTVDVTDVINSHKDAFMAEQADGIVDGKYGYIATGTGGGYGLAINMTLAEQLGVADLIPADRSTWSYDQFLEVLRKAKAADPTVIPIGLFAGSRSSDAFYYSWYLGNGVKLTNDDLTATAFNEGESREKAIEVLDVFKTIIDEGLTIDGAATTIDQECEAMFFAGNMLFESNTLNCVPGIATVQEAGTCADFKVDACAIPTKEGKEAPITACFGSNGFAGFKNNGHEEEIKLALSVWLENPQYQGEFCHVTGYLPLMNGATFEIPDAYQKEKYEYGVKYTAEHAVSNFGILKPWWSDFRETHYPQMQDFYVGKQDAGSMLDNWQKNADDVIKKANS